VRLHGFAKYGDFSYGIYLYGWPIQQLLMMYAGRVLNVYGLFIVAMALVLPAAAFSWFCIERPFLRLNHKPVAVPHSVLTR
jgi:peptidoglycan/LPS O-acetylase OafA/YrhL